MSIEPSCICLTKKKQYQDVQLSQPLQPRLSRRRPLNQRKTTKNQYLVLVDELEKIQQQRNQHAPRKNVHYVKMNRLAVAQTRKHLLTDQTAKVAVWNLHMAVAPITTIRHVDQILKDANANIHRMDVVLITERPPEGMKMPVAVVNTKNTAVAQVIIFH